MLSNFMSNVMKFTNESSICIGLHDSGIGILQEKQSSIFEHFVKVNEFSQGTGLGLSICKEIADQLGGHISLTSIPDRGSCFSLCLPKK